MSFLRTRFLRLSNLRDAWIIILASVTFDIVHHCTLWGRTVTSNVRFKDFTLDRPPIKFAINGENFDAVPALGISLLQQIGDVAGKFADESDVDPKNLGEKLQAFIDMCGAILEPESAVRFVNLAPRLDIQEQIVPLLFWLLEAYGLRPTEVSSDSSTSSPNEIDGTTSEDGVSSLVSMSEISLPMSSLT